MNGFPSFLREKLPTAVLYLLTATIPILITAFWINIYFGATFKDYIPSISDSIDYWHEVSSFLHAPFSGGYYGYQQLHAAIGNYGGHGVWIIALLAAMARLLGWTLSNFWQFSAVFLAVGLGAYMVLAKPRPLEMLLLIALFTVFGPVQQGMAWLMPDMLNLGLGFLFAGLFVRLNATDRPLRVLWALLFITAAATLLRKTWVLLFLAYAAIPLTLNLRAGWRYFVSLGALALSSVMLFNRTLAPYPYRETFYSGFAWKAALAGDFRPMLDSLAYSSTSIFTIYREVFYYNIFALHMLFCSIAIICYCTAKKNYNIVDFIIAAILPVSILSYIFGHLFNGIVAFRHVTPFFVILILSTGLKRAKPVFILIIILNLLMYPAFLKSFREMNQYAYTNKLADEIQETHKKLEAALIPANNGNRWCDTVLIDNYPVELLALPPTLAFNFFNLEYHDKSIPIFPKYIFTNNIDKFKQLGLNLTRILDTKSGTFYAREMTECLSR